MPPPVPIPTATSTSSRPAMRLENMLASFEEPGRLGYGRRDSSHGSLSQSSAAAGILAGPTVGMTPPSYSLSHAASSSYQPRVVRASPSTMAASHEPASAGTRHSISPTRHRVHSSNPLARPQVASRQQSGIPQVPSIPFTPPAYLSQALLSNLFRGGAFSPRESTPEPRVVPDAPSSMTDSEDSTGGTSRVAGIRRRRRTAAPKEVATWPTTLCFPTVWSETDKSPQLTLSPSGKEASFNGHSSIMEGREARAAAVRAECPIPPACGIFYYEVTIVNRGNKGQISIGFATKDMELTKLPGWDTGSWGYHGDDGLSFMGQPRTGAPYGPQFTTNDIIGCGVNFVTHDAFYTKNGKPLGSVFKNLPDQDLYPALGLLSANEHVKTNFGDSEFLFNIDEYVAQFKRELWRTVQDQSLVQCRPSVDEATYNLRSLSIPKRLDRNDTVFRASRAKDEDLGSAMADLVLEYLMFQGYASTARSFHKGLLGKSGNVVSETQDESMDIDAAGSMAEHFDATERRARITGAIIKGDIEIALGAIKSWFPASLTYEGGIIDFKLRCRRFVELILEAYEVKRRIERDADSMVTDGAGAGAVAIEGANAMDLDDEEHLPISPTSHSSPWSVNGSGIPASTLASPMTKSKGKQRRRSSASRPSGSLVRAASRTRGGQRGGSLLSPMASNVSREESSEVIERIQRVLEYGTSLRKDWEGDERPSVAEQLKRTLGLVAHEDPYSDARSKELVSPEARVALAEEVNLAILVTTFHSNRSSLERLYRQTGTAMEALGAVEVGSGALVDVSRILDELV